MPTQWECHHAGQGAGRVPPLHSSVLPSSGTDIHSSPPRQYPSFGASRISTIIFRRTLTAVILRSFRDSMTPSRCLSFFTLSAERTLCILISFSMIACAPSYMEAPTFLTPSFSSSRPTSFYHDLTRHVVPQLREEGLSVLAVLHSRRRRQLPQRA